MDAAVDAVDRDAGSSTAESSLELPRLCFPDLSEGQIRPHPAIDAGDIEVCIDICRQSKFDLSIDAIDPKPACAELCDRDRGCAVDSIQFADSAGMNDLDSAVDSIDSDRAGDRGDLNRAIHA